jgi:hypothetical protein
LRKQDPLSAAPSPDAEAPELSAYLSEHLYDLGISGWTVTVTKDGDAATQGPDGSPEPTEGSNETPGNDDPFLLRRIPDGQ